MERAWQAAAPIVARAALPAALIAAAVAIHLWVHRFVGRNPEFVVPASAWKSSGLLERGEADVSIFDERALERAARAIEARPEVRRVTRLERSFPGSVRARLERREPWLAVRVGAAWAIFDRERVLMAAAPDTGATPACGSGLAVLGARDPLPPAGGVAESRELVAAFEAAELVAALEPLRSLVAAIDVSNLDRRRSASEPDLVLVARGGCRIHWGRLAGPEAEELGADEKIGNLRAALQRYPGLQGLEYVKVYIKDRPTVRRVAPPDRLASGRR
jgi:hypothetical protein